VIDIDIVLRSSDQVASVIQLLAPLGYHHEGNQGVVGREAFSWPSGERRHHVYVVTRGSPSHRRHVVIRDYLRAHPDEGRAYRSDHAFLMDTKTHGAHQHRVRHRIAPALRDSVDGHFWLAEVATARCSVDHPILHAYEALASAPTHGSRRHPSKQNSLPSGSRSTTHGASSP
jgi:GrpB protein